MAHDAAVIGAGPNGLAAAVTLARAGLSVRLIERNATVGGAARTQELGYPGAIHDLGSAVHPMALVSPFFRQIGLREHVDFVVPEISFAHPLADGRAGIAWRDLERTVAGLASEGPGYGKVFGPVVRRMGQTSDMLMHPLLRIPRHPAALAIFGLRAAQLMVPGLGTGPMAAAMIAGCGAHTAGGGRGPAATGAGLFLGAAAHSGGWPIPIGGSQAISDALAGMLVSAGGSIELDTEVTDLAQLPEKTVLFDTSPEAMASIAGSVLPQKYTKVLTGTRRPPGSCLIHYVLNAPVPWRNPELADAGTIHLGGTAAQIGREERRVRTDVSSVPYAIVSQPSRFDASRAPEGKHVLWAYCHVPNGNPADLTTVMNRQLEAVAPGFTDTIEYSQAVTAPGLAAQNPNLVGGDLSGGATDMRGMLIRPTLSTDPWRTPAKGIYLASSSTPPGPSVHGMSGHLAAKSALRHEFGIQR
ncbi:NAD(P)/FAD-dependent oxidoreductase [Paeniglutamicibacter psychrophenolicus]|uniref:Phytoene dehydrogenase-like protein n=1 Tax=Paeniglutamicibacter psychrophenolicus TaxID=257454 RepID=A0ABS4W9G4_9MICC|nr:NAD(P)/FAD-dependent oxidoreductase [Paeniglutamicibacter psychrophenolicus]MBP2372671.1 phytoene dehydrogenase-like protein [Paeniglutamicibacter psychrophenolicus]